MATTYLTRTPSSTGNRQKFTFSAWLKKATTDVDLGVFGEFENSSNRFRIKFRSDDKLQVDNSDSGSSTMSVICEAKLRDTSAWYHLVVAIDTTQSTASDRVKIYFNNVLQTVFQVATYPSQNSNTFISLLGWPMEVGRTTASNYWSGIMSHVHLCDGQSYAPTEFGETDATTGEWKIKTSPSVTYGTNGFFILKNGNSVTDQSGNSNNFTVGGGTLTNTEDCPSNVFATGNPLSPYGNRTISNGNLTTTSTTTNWTSVFSTIGVSTGKWYIELKATAGSYHSFGIVDDFAISGNESLGDFADSRVNQQIGYYGYYGTKKVNQTTSSYGDSWTNGDIISMALDLDNNKLYFAKNGTWQNSGVPTSGSTGTGAISVNSGYTYFIGTSNYNSSATTFNFGNGYFGTTAVSSAGTNASGNGIFEYDVPTGYTALSTKGLNL